MSENRDKQYKYERCSKDAHLISEIATRLSFCSGLIQEKRLTDDEYDDYEKRQLVEIKKMMAMIYSQLDLEHVETRYDELFKGSQEDKE